MSFRRTVVSLLALLGSGVLVSAQDPLREVDRLLGAGRPAAALRLLDRLPDARAAAPDAVRCFVRAYRELGDHEHVLAYGAPVIAERPEDVEMQVWVGQALSNLGAMPGLAEDRALAYREQALDCARAALRVAPEDDGAIELEVWTLADLGQGDEALAKARAALERRPKEPGRHRLVANVHELSGRVGDAIAALHQAERAFPGDGQWPLERSLLHFRWQQPDEARRALREAVKAASLAPPVSEQVGEQVWSLHGIHRDFAGAREVVDLWIEAHPDDSRAWWWRGYQAELEGNAEAARDAFATAWSKSRQQLGDAALHLGLMAAAGKDEKTALDLLARAMKLGARARPGTRAAEDAVLEIAKVHFDAGRLARAAEILEENGVRHAPAHPLLRQTLGFVLRELGTQAAVKGDAAKARKLWKRSADHYVAAAESILESDHPDRVKAQVLNDTGLMFHYHLEDVDRGIAYYESALEHDPGYLDTLENLGVAMGMKGRWEEAIAWFDKVLAIAPYRAASIAGKKHAEAELRKR